MSVYSAFVDNLTEIIQQETANAFEKCMRVEKKPKLAAEHESAVLEGFCNEIHIPIIRKPSKSTADIVEELGLLCHEIAEICLAADLYQPEFPLRAPHVADESTNKLYPRLSASFVNSIALELEHLVMTYCMRLKRSEKDSKLWSSLFLQDLKQAVAVTYERSTEGMEHNLSLAWIRLGRIYAWAREPSTLVDENDADQEATKALEQVKRRIRSKLSRLVLLCRVGKQYVRSHPILASMRHELLRIRTELTSSLNSDRTATIGPIPTGVLYIPSWEEDCDRALKRLVPPNLGLAFCQLIDQLTDVLLQLPSTVPGISVPAANSYSVGEQRTQWRNVVAQTVMNFHSHQDTWVGIDLQTDCRIIDSQAPREALSFLTSQSDSEDSSDEAKPNTLPSVVDPALVQAVLDRFDHHNRNSRKRHFSGAGDTFEVDSEPLPKLTKLSVDPTTIDPGLQRPSSSLLPRQIEPSGLDRSPTRTVDLDHAVSTGPPDSKSTDPPGPFNGTATTEDTSSINDTADSPITTNRDPTTTGSRPQACKPRRSLRSLRTRSHTPSEASYSEGEVLSDSDEDRDGSSSVGEANETVPELLGEKISAEGQDDERAAEIIQLVHNQLRDATPVSDIDLTELEIMDEWATPAMVASSGIGDSGRIDTESADATNCGDQPVEEPKVENSQPDIIEMDKRLTELTKDALTICDDDMERLIDNALTLKELNSELASQRNTTIFSPIHLSEELEASIHRTASAFEEHVTSVLANLLHAIPLSVGPGVSVCFKRQSARPVVCGRRGSRLLGMLKAYQQDVTKRISSSTAV